MVFNVISLIAIKLNNMNCYLKYILIWLIQGFYAAVGISEENGYKNGRQQYCRNHTKHMPLDNLSTPGSALDINISLDYLRNLSHPIPYAHFYLHEVNNNGSEPNVFLDIKWEVTNELSNLHYTIKTLDSKVGNINGSVPLPDQKKDSLLKFEMGIYLNTVENNFIIYTTNKGRNNNKILLLEVDLFNSVAQLFTKFTHQLGVSLNSNACVTSDLRLQKNESLG